MLLAALTLQPLCQCENFENSARLRLIFSLNSVLDVGTDNEGYLKDPDYLGLRQRRPESDVYLEFVDEFMWSVQQRWPKALVQFEDFQNKYACEYSLHRSPHVVYRFLFFATQQTHCFTNIER